MGRKGLSSAKGSLRGSQVLVHNFLSEEGLWAAKLKGKAPIIFSLRKMSPVFSPFLEKFKISKSLNKFSQLYFPELTTINTQTDGPPFSKNDLFIPILCILVFYFMYIGVLYLFIYIAPVSV